MKMTIMQHFAELRRRVVWIMLIFACAFGIGFLIAPYSQELLLHPLISVWPSGTVLYTKVTDGLFIELSMATLFAICVALPAVLWHLWAFVAPGLRPTERKMISPILAISPVLFVLGAAFAYFFLFPVAFKFFISLNETNAMPSVLMPVVSDYLGFVISLLKVFGLAFQLPLVLVVLNRIGILSRAAAVKARRYAIVGIFVIAAVLTPPDILSQILLGVPLLALFEISILFMKKSESREQRAESK